ncbi:MAG TPA: hypothetical protein IAC46_04685 [Candidatus Onthoplasma faecigallinarum]|nr:hypothetical protein [Candidatus Onthoplasma faecigallinarum]
MENRICFISYKTSLPSNIDEKLYNVILQEIYSGHKNFMMGTHGKFDNISLAVCKRLSKDFAIEIEIAITDLYQKKVVQILNKLDKLYNKQHNEPILSMFNIEETNLKDKIISNYKQMINCSSTLICYFNEKNHNSINTFILDYAKQKGLKIINLYDNK